MSQFSYKFAHWDLFGVILIRQTITIDYNNLEKIYKILYIFTWGFKYIGICKVWILKKYIKYT